MSWEELNLAMKIRAKYGKRVIWIEPLPQGSYPSSPILMATLTVGDEPSQTQEIRSYHLVGKNLQEWKGSQP